MLQELASTFRGRSVLITGGLGFIGSTLAQALVHMGAEVMIVDSLIPTYGGNEFNIEPFKDDVAVDYTDIRNTEVMGKLVAGKDYLFNLAGQTSHMDSMSDPYTDLDINCRAQLSILEACRATNQDVKLVFASTRQIYGRPDYLPVDERHLLRPVDVNGINKMAGEWYHVLYNQVYGIRGCSLRLTNTYGPRMRVKDARQTFLGIWIRLLLQEQPVQVWGGGQLRDYTYVDDAVHAFLLAAASDRANGRVFNLGGDRPYSLRETAELLVEANGGGEIEFRDYPAERSAIDIGDYYADYFAIMSELGWSPQTDLKAGFESTVEYYRSNLERYLERP